MIMDRVEGLLGEEGMVGEEGGRGEGGEGEEEKRRMIRVEGGTEGVVR